MCQFTKGEYPSIMYDVYQRYTPQVFHSTKSDTQMSYWTFKWTPFPDGQKRKGGCINVQHSMKTCYYNQLHDLLVVHHTVSVCIKLQIRHQFLIGNRIQLLSILTKFRLKTIVVLLYFWNKWEYRNQLLKSLFTLKECNYMIIHLQGNNVSLFISSHYDYFK